MENVVTKMEGTKVEKKYTVREVLDSLSWTLHDADDDYDGFLRVGSNINGGEIKIPVKVLVEDLSKLGVCSVIE